VDLLSLGFLAQWRIWPPRLVNTICEEDLGRKSVVIPRALIPCGRSSYMPIFLAGTLSALSIPRSSAESSQHPAALVSSFSLYQESRYATCIIIHIHIILGSYVCM